ncbi:hypothetical protein ACFE04_015680 [Oxalis oulophora]
MAAKFRELVKKYGKVALGVHCTISAASVTGLYIAIKNNVDVESIFQKLHLAEKHEDKQVPPIALDDDQINNNNNKKINRTAEIAGSTGGAFALALLCNKALFPIRVPITLALTPPISKMLVRRGIIKSATGV